MKTNFLRFMVTLILLIAIPVNVQAKAEYDFKEPSDVSSQTLKNALYHDLKDYADIFIECEEEHKINAIALAAVAALESGWGRSDLAESSNNLFGWKTNDGDYMSFESYEECIQYVAKSMSEMYLDEKGEYYTGGTKVKHVANLYCDEPEWEKEVNNLIYDILWRCENNV